MKHCIKCREGIEEFNREARWVMIITKQGQRIVEFECFHLGCWKRHIEEAVGVGVKEKLLEEAY